MLHRKFFFDTVRYYLFYGAMHQSQVDGCNYLLDYAELNCTDFRQLAYILATAYHETARTMEPIEEYGKGAGHSYGVPDPETGETYYGRGYVQLTWKENYEKMTPITGVDLVWNPDLALVPEYASVIIFHGMYDGIFTGVGLNDYINEVETDWFNARKIVNALDRASEIEDYAKKFHYALSWTYNITTYNYNP